MRTECDKSDSTFEPKARQIYNIYIIYDIDICFHMYYDININSLVISLH